ncbi:NADPH-dependent F420 reductase [Arthrobacter sp. MMS18-M83]|uniref:NADPH-dependent F420 reductase n=1 Tax=Arthrobacter sp. MMS18-M83 TaxID=2996261 RepID=UPI00227CCC61|nr:NADP oxidoreductase [Arthrobacter sp. MMS18-M83]WAH97262.1 NADP oxidoreductase [Arthrobacter sp. MMS18-M83]
MGNSGRPLEDWRARAGVLDEEPGKAERALTVGGAVKDSRGGIGAVEYDEQFVREPLGVLSTGVERQGAEPVPHLLFVPDSLGEQIQRAFPAARVVKSLNTMNAALMTHPDRLTEASTVFVSGNDADAKNTVTGLVNGFGHQDVIDLGDITTARGTEMLLPVWLRLWGALGTPNFNFKIVR